MWRAEVKINLDSGLCENYDNKGWADVDTRISLDHGKAPLRGGWAWIVGNLYISCCTIKNVYQSGSSATSLD